MHQGFPTARKVACSVQLCNGPVSLMELRGTKPATDSIHRANTGYRPREK